MLVVGFFVFVLSWVIVGGSYYFLLVVDLLVLEECGICYLVFVLLMLLVVLWKCMMGDLENYFGDNVVVDFVLVEKIIVYLVDNVGDIGGWCYGEKLLCGVNLDKVLLCIIELLKWLCEYCKVLDWEWWYKEVWMWVNCVVCYVDVECGYYDE